MDHMAAKLPSAELSANALEHRSRGESDQQPHVDGPEQGSQQTESGRFGFTLRRVQGASILLLMLGVAAAQVAWIALLAYGAYRLGTSL
jgi:hypothetical protein